MIDSEYSTDVYKSINAKNVLDHLKTKRMCKHAVKKFAFRKRICS